MLLCIRRAKYKVKDKINAFMWREQLPIQSYPKKNPAANVQIPAYSIYTVLGLARFNELWWGSERPTDNRTFERSLGIRIDTLFWILLNFLLTFASPAIYYHISGPAQSNPNLCVIFKYFLNISAARTSHSRRNWKVPRKWQMLYLCMIFKRTTHIHTLRHIQPGVLCRWSVWKINCETRCFCTSCNNSWKTPNKTNLTNCKISYCDCVCHCVSLQLCTQVLSTSLSLSLSLSLYCFSVSFSVAHTHICHRTLALFVCASIWKCKLWKSVRKCLQLLRS